MKEESQDMAEEKFEVLATGEKVKAFQKKLRKKATLGCSSSPKKKSKEEPEKIPKDVQFVKISKAIFTNDGIELRESFLMCHKMFVTPHNETLTSIWLSQFETLLEELKQFNSTRTHEKIDKLINFMHTWAVQFPEDFTDEDQKKAISKGLAAAINEKNESAVSMIISVMLPPSVRICEEPKFQANSKLAFHNIHPRAMAVAITLTEFQRFKQMQGREFVDMAWHSKDKDILAPNVTFLSDNFNKISYWVAFMVLRHQKSPMNTQVFVVKKLIYVSYYLQKVCRNYNGLMEILLGLGLAQIKRKSVWEHVSQKVKILYKTLHKTMLPWNNFAQYKKKFKKLGTPKVPYFPLFCKDFTFIHEAIPKYSRHLLNLQLPLALNSHFLTLKSYVEGKYHLKVEEGVMAFIESLPVLTEKILERLEDPECDDYDDLVCSFEVDTASVDATLSLNLSSDFSGSVS